MTTARRRLPWAVVGLTLIVTVVATWAYGAARSNLDETRAAQDAATAAREAAQEAIPRLLSYDHRALNRDLTAAQQQVTGAFLPEFKELQHELIEPATRTQKLTTTATVDRLATVSSSRTSVRILAFVRQRTAAPDRRPTESVARAVLTMVLVNGRWLTGNLEAL